MMEKLNKILMWCWAAWVIVFCLATFTDVGFFDTANNLLMTIVCSVQFLYLFRTKKGGLKWLFFVCTLISLALFVFAVYSTIQ